MNTASTNQQPQESRFQPLKLISSVALALLVMAAMLLLLNALGITPVPAVWSNALTVIFTTLGAIAAVIPLLFPKLIKSSKEASDPLQTGIITYPTDHAIEILRQWTERSIDKRLGRGCLMVCTDDTHVGQEIKIVPQSSWVRNPHIREQLSDIQTKTVKLEKVNDTYLCIAIFRNLNPDVYMIWLEINHSISTPIFSNELTVIDLR